jgi:hypothetical protein
MHLALAIDQVVWKFQLLKVQVTLAMYAVPERSKAIAQLSWKLMHRWTCLGVCCGSCMTVLETSEGTLKERLIWPLLPQLDHDFRSAAPSFSPT